MKKVVIRRNTFGENTYRPYIGSTKQILQIEQGNTGIPLNEVLQELQEKSGLEDLAGNISGIVTEDGGEPDVDITVEEGVMNFAFKNIKGQDGQNGQDGAPGATGATGATGPQGDSAIWTGEGEPWSGLKNTTGQSTTEPMTQKAVTELTFFEVIPTNWGSIAPSQGYAGSNKWNSSSASYKYVQVNISAYKGKIIKIVKSESAADSPYVVVSKNAFSAGQSISYATGYPSILGVTQDTYITVPNDDTVYLYVSTLRNNNSTAFAAYVIDTIYNQLDKLSDDAASMQTSLSDLASEIDDVKILKSEEYDLTALTPINKSIQTSGSSKVWKEDGSSYLIPFNAGDTVKVIGNGSTQYNVEFLSSNSTTTNTKASYAGEQNGYKSGVNILVAPTGTNYMYIRYMIASADHRPSYIGKVTYIKDETEKISEDLSLLAEQVTSLSNVSESGDYIHTEQGYVNDEGNIVSSQSYVTTSPISGGRGFCMALMDGYRMDSVHLFNADDGSLACYNYVSPILSTGGQYSGMRQEWGSDAIPPQFIVRVVIKAADDSNIMAGDGIIKSFSYVDKYKRLVPDGLPLATAKRRMLHLSNVVWTALEDITVYNSTISQLHFKKGIKRNGIPYSDCANYDKYVGQHVSVYTFLMATLNKRSLLYTEKCYNGENGTPHSEYGMDYSDNYNLAVTYFGQACSGFTGYVANLKALYIAANYTNGTVAGLSTVSNADFDTVQPLDFIWSNGHIAMVADVLLDEYGERKYVVWAEETQPCTYMEPMTKYKFNKRLADFSCEVRRPSNISTFWANLPEPPAALTFMQESMLDYPRPPYWGGDIMTFAGDKACFAVGDKVFLNLYRGNGYDTLEIYKDDELVNTVDITNTTTYPSDGLYTSDNEDWVKFDAASYCDSAGKYKARLTGESGSKESDYTYWEMIAITFSANVSGTTVSTTFAATGGTPYLIQKENHNGFPNAYHSISTSEIGSGTATMTSWSTASGYTYIKIFVRGDYGVVIQKVNTAS